MEPPFFPFDDSAVFVVKTVLRHSLFKKNPAIRFTDQTTFVKQEVYSES